MAEDEQRPQGQVPPADGGEQEKPKIIVDDDWKAQARAEKERLAKEVEKEAPAEDEAGRAGGGAGRRQPIPPATITSLINQVAVQVAASLGAYEDPTTKRRYVDLELAKYHVDTLSVLEKKTKGNLTDEEKRVLDRVLYESRMMYVQMAQRIASS